MSRPISEPARIPFGTTAHVRHHCLCLHAQRAARGLARRFDRALRPLGLTNGQFSLMMSLNRPQPAGMGSVAALLGLDRTTLTAALKPLERRGLVATAPHPDDKRSRLMRLTPQGHALLAEAVPIWRDTHAEVDRVLAEHGAGDLRAGLRVLG